MLHRVYNLHHHATLVNFFFERTYAYGVLLFFCSSKRKVTKRKGRRNLNPRSRNDYHSQTYCHSLLQPFADSMTGNPRVSPHTQPKFRVQRLMMKSNKTAKRKGTVPALNIKSGYVITLKRFSFLFDFSFRFVVFLSLFCHEPRYSATPARPKFWLPRFSHLSHPFLANHIGTGRWLSAKMRHLRVKIRRFCDGFQM